MSEHTFEVTDDNFQDQVLSSQTPVLVDFWATWCGPCKMVAPEVEKLSREFGANLRVGKMDVDAQPNVPERFGIQSIPTLMLFKGGEPVAQIVGYRTKDQLKKAIEKYVEVQPA